MRPPRARHVVRAPGRIAPRPRAHRARAAARRRAALSTGASCPSTRRCCARSARRRRKCSRWWPASTSRRRASRPRCIARACAIEQAARAERALAGLAIVSLSTRTVVHKALVDAATRSTVLSAIWATRLRIAVHHVPPALQHQHVGGLGAGAAVPHARAQRRDQHHRRQPPLDARARRRRDRRCPASTARRADVDARLRFAVARRCRRAAAAQRLLARRTRSSRLVPPAWERDRDLPPDVRAFYEFQSLVSEPWDGPVGAGLRRRPLSSARRSIATASVRARVVDRGDDLIAVASEVGVLDRPTSTRSSTAAASAPAT